MTSLFGLSNWNLGQPYHLSCSETLIIVKGRDVGEKNDDYFLYVKPIYFGVSLLTWKIFWNKSVNRLGQQGYSKFIYKYEFKTKGSCINGPFRL